MKKNIIYILLILLAITSCSKQPITKEEAKILVIDLDKEVEPKYSGDDLRGKNRLLVDTPIYIGDNDEVAFKGDILDKNSPLKVKIGDNDEVAFRNKHYIINTLELKSGDLIQIINKEGKVFIEMEVIR